MIVTKFLNRSSMCILSYWGRMRDYVECKSFDESFFQFLEVIPDISLYVEGIDPRPFFVNKELDEQNIFVPDYHTDYLGAIGNMFSEYIGSNWNFNGNSQKDLYNVFVKLAKLRPNMVDNSIICTQQQFEDIRAEYLRKGKVDLKKILSSKDYSIKFEVNSIWA